MDFEIIETNKSLTEFQKQTIKILLQTIEKYEDIDSLSINENRVEILCDKQEHLFIVNDDGSLS